LQRVELLHVPIKRVYERTLFRVFHERELVHVEYPTEGWGNSVLPSFLPVVKGRTKLLLTLHEWGQMNRLRRASILPLVSRADGFVFVSEQEREAFFASAPNVAKRKPTWVIPIGVNLEIPELSPAEIGAFRAGLCTVGHNLALAENPPDLIITHFGFIHQGKQPTKLLDALEALRTFGRNPRLIFIGDFQKDKQEERSAFVQEIERRGLSELIQMRGFVHDDKEAALLMAAADVSVSLFSDGLTPRRGSFWYATQHGRPTITTEPERERLSVRDFGAVGEHLKPPQVHFVKPQTSGEAIAQVIANLPPYRAKELSPLPVPTWREIAERHNAVYEELLGRG
jgi:glycosyltransferase involved in cell wall biosynthesis